VNVTNDLVSVRYMVNDVQESIDFYTRHLGFGGWNRIHFIVEDIEGEVARLRDAGVSLPNDIVSGPGGQQIVLDDPSGNPIELFQPASR